MIDEFESYFMPACFLIGLFGNTIGSLCLFSKRRLRKRVSLFALASLGVSDSIFLFTQLERWLAQNIDLSAYIDSNLQCQLYFMLTRSSIMISASLLFCMITARFIAFYKGKFQLSLYTNIGQIFSHLCVALSVIFCLSISWHAGITGGNKI